MSKDKYLSMFLHQMEAVVFIFLQILFVTCTVSKIGEYHSDVSQFQLGHIQSCDMFRLIMFQ